VEKFDAVVVGAGPAGISASYLLAQAGLKVILIERGDFPGAKNVMGGVLYRHPTEQIFPGFWKTAPLERHVIEQRVWLLAEDSVVTLGHRNRAFAEPPYNCFTVLRAKFDKWLAQQAREAGVLVVPETVVEDVIREDGRIVGVRTGRDKGEVYADVVVAADGVNSLLAQKAGLHPEWKPDQVAVTVKEVLALPKAVIQDRFNVAEGEGVTIEMFGASTAGMVGTAFLYTNSESLSIGVGVLLSDLIERGKNCNDLLEQLKAHPVIAPLVEGAELREYLAHLIPEGGYYAIPRLYTDGMVVVGDAAMLVNGLHREGSNLAMLSGKYAAEAILRAKEWNDFSAASLSRYEQLLRESHVMRDLYKYRRATRFFERHHDFLGLYPALANDAAEAMMTVDSTSKRQKQWQIFGLARQRKPLWRMAKDFWGAWRAMW